MTVEVIGRLVQIAAAETVKSLAPTTASCSTNCKKESSIVLEHCSIVDDDCGCACVKQHF